MPSVTLSNPIFSSLRIWSDAYQKFRFEVVLQIKLQRLKNAHGWEEAKVMAKSLKCLLCKQEDLHSFQKTP